MSASSGSFPNEYKRFLRGDYPAVEKTLAGSDFNARHLPKLRAWATELLAENQNPFTLEDSDLVFLVHQGYQFLFLRCDGSDDPPVFHYCEGEPGPAKKYEHFTEWLADCTKPTNS